MIKTEEGRIRCRFCDLEHLGDLGFKRNIKQMGNFYLVIKGSILIGA